MTLTRRDLFKRSAAAGVGVAVAGSLDSFFAATPALAQPVQGAGPLVADPDGILDLPKGFRYQIVTRAGDPLVGPSGVVPGRPDGMGVFAAERKKALFLVQNHEQSDSGVRAVAAADHTYDPGAWGGTTTLALTKDNRLVDEYVSIAGTFSNCAGGITPWDTWLTCEETEQKAGGAFTKNHGYVFEVDPADDANNVNPTPLVNLGRFAHEAAAIDPRTGTVYLTEDASSPNGLLYRFVPARKPRTYGDLRGPGQLQAMYVSGVTDLSVFTAPGTTLSGITWKDVPDPTALTLGSTRKQFTYTTFPAGATVTGPGGDVTRSKKLEGLWWGNGKVNIVCSFAHGSVDWSTGTHDGQVWSYDPSADTLTLEVRFAPAVNPDVDFDGPDNITVSPFGGFFLAEDGAGTQHLLAVDDDGETTAFARNAMSGSEFTGVVFAPDAKTLFANIQDEGLTFAITGPFATLHRGRAGPH